MKLLFLTPQLPYPPRQGAAIRNWHFIRGLAEQHAITLLTFGTEADVTPEVRAVCQQVVVVPLPHRRIRHRLRTLFMTRLPDMAQRLWSVPFAAHLRQLLTTEQYDWVQIEGIELAPYMLLAQALGWAAPGTRWLFDEHNAEYLLQRRAFQADAGGLRTWPKAAYSLVQWDRLRRYERRACQAAGAVVAVSGADRLALLTLDPSLPITVVPNGVDLDEWNPQAVAPDRDAARLAAVGPLIVFDGSMDFRPNVDAVRWFVDAVWPQVQASAPLAQFAIVGRNPTAAVRALEDHRGVVVTGLVADTRPWVAAAAVYVVPMRIGGGVRLKVLQALAMERALVSTTLGCEGVTVTANVDVLLADDAPTFAWAVGQLVQQPARAHALGQAARALASNYAWDRLVPRLEAVLRET